MSDKILPSRILGIDYGLVRIGLSLSDERKIFASPLPNFLADTKMEKTLKNLLNYIQEIEDKNKCTLECIVIGIPLLMSGKPGPLADEVTHFMTLFRSLSSIPIISWDERLTSVQADRSLREGNLSRKKRAKLVDAVSAVILLQSYLDSRSIQLS